MPPEKCKTCYSDIVPPGILLRLDMIDRLHSISLGAKLGQCIPELLQELNTSKDKICKNCLNLLGTAYSFRKMCLNTQALFKSLEPVGESIKSEPEEIFVPLDIVKTEIGDEDVVIQDLTTEDDTSESQCNTDTDEVRTFGTVNNDVIKGDISVGFEITSAKKIHNTVSVSFTTNADKNCMFQTEKRTDVESDLHCKRKPPEQTCTKTIGLECIETENHIRLDTNLQKKCELSDIEIIANIFKQTQNMNDVNILNSFVKLDKMDKTMSTLLLSKRSAYVCKSCQHILLTRSGLQRHVLKHSRRIAFVKTDPISKSKQKVSLTYHNRQKQALQKELRALNIKQELSGVPAAHKPNEQLSSPSRILLRRDIKVEPEDPEPSKVSTPTLQRTVANTRSLKRKIAPSNILWGQNTRTKPSNSATKTSIPPTKMPNRQTKMSIPQTKACIPQRKPSIPQTKTSIPPQTKMSIPRTNKIVPQTKLQVTIKTEPNEPEMTCQHCNISFRSSNIYNLHMTLHPTTSTQTTDDVVQHVKFTNRYLCSVCKKTFPTQNQLNGHLSMHSKKHWKNRNGVGDGKSPKLPPKKRTPTKTKSNENKEINSQTRPNTSGNDINHVSQNNKLNVECKLCFKKFESTNHYNAHVCMRVNESQKMFKCAVCRNNFLGRNKFIEHVRSHLNKVK